jgi:hypothetical protein
VEELFVITSGHLLVVIFVEVKGQVCHDIVENRKINNDPEMSLGCFVLYHHLVQEWLKA